MRILISILVVLFGSPLFLWAQESDERSVELDLRSDGSASLFFFADRDPGPSRRLGEDLTRVFGTPIEVLQREKVDGDWWVYARGERVFRRRGWSLTGTLPMPELREFLFDAGSRADTLIVTVPARGTTTVQGEDRPLEGEVREGTRGTEITLSLAPVSETTSLDLAFSVTYSAGDLLLLFAPFAGLLLLIVAVAATIRIRLLSVEPFEATRYWLPFWRIKRALTLGAWFFWLILGFGVGLLRFFAWVLFDSSSLEICVVVSFAGIVPPLVALGIGHGLLNDVLVRRFERRQTRWDAVWQTLSAQCRFLVPVTMAALATFALLRGETRDGVILGFAGLLGFILTTVWFAKTLGLGAYSLTEGELRDRIFEMASEAGVTVRQVLIGSPGKIGISTAAVLRQGTLYLTDDLVRRLSRAQVDAILAHELAHLGKRDLLWLQLSFALTALPLSFFVLLVLKISALTPLGLTLLFACFGLGFLAKSAVSRSVERRADRGASAQCGDPESLIQGLARLSHLNFLPLEWGPWSRIWMSHPSLGERARTLAALANIGEERLRELLEGDHEEEGYSIPTVAASEEAVFSSRFKQSAATLYLWVFRSVDVLIPVGIAAWIAPRFEVGVGRGVVYVCGALGTGVAAHLVSGIWGRWLFRKIIPRLRERLAAESIPIEEGEFVTFAPDGSPRLYDGYFFWDVGFLFRTESDVAYVGEKCRWRLTRDHVQGVSRTHGPPGWSKKQGVRLEWRCEEDDDPSSRPAFSLLPPPGPSSQKVRSEELLRDLEHWHRGLAGAPDTSLSPALQSLPQPPREQVTSLDPKFLRRPQFVIRDVFQGGGAAFCLGILLGLPFSGEDSLFGWYPVIVAGLIAVWDHLPYWVRRDPEVE